MTRSPRHVLAPALAPLLALSALCLGGCAVSPISDDDAAIDLDLDDASVEANESPASGEDDSDEGDEKPPARRDSGARDAGAPSVSARDSGAAQAKDAGGAAKDSGAHKPTTDAGSTKPSSPPASGTCRQDADCTQSCVPIGILSCCKADRSCGCTWAPGAYCL